MRKRIYQFGFKFFSPSALGWNPVVDCRIMRNPFRQGIPEDVLKADVRALPEFEGLVQYGMFHLNEVDVIYVGCLYGRHRSGAVAEEIAKRTGAVVQKIGDVAGLRSL